MSIRFAAPRKPGHSPACSPVARAMARKAYGAAANDNGDIAPTAAREARILRAALRHFSEYGIGAARVARANAEEAFFAGDRQGYDWWLSVTQALDRRMAAEMRPLNCPANGNSTA
ncbi:MAG: hypothetical protein WBG48_09860 [Pricia sp.]